MVLARVRPASAGSACATGRADAMPPSSTAAMVGEIPVLWVEPTAAPPNERRQLIIWLPCARKSQHRTALPPHSR